MPNGYRDDSPTAFGLGRRRLLFGGVSLFGGLAVVRTLPAIANAGSWSNEFGERFMEISSLLISHHLHEDVGKRIGAAMSVLDPSLSEQVAGLLAIAKAGMRGLSRSFIPTCRKGRLGRRRSRSFPLGISAS